jgi:hygromycin-B 7''-O-kinase
MGPFVPSATVPPPEVPVDEGVLRAIADRHGITWSTPDRLPSVGFINVVYAVGDIVVRVPKDHPGHVFQAGVEAATIPRAVAAGVTTPALVAYDDSRDLLPVPYLVVERVDGRDLESRGIDPDDVPDVLRAVGRDLAVLHAIDEPGPARPFTHEVHALVEQRIAEGWISTYEAGWLHRWLDELDRPRPEPVLVHGDVQLSNILVDDDLQYVALVDWGCSVPGDAAIDFMPTPQRARPALLAGYREAGGEIDEARILRGQLVTLLRELHRGAVPGRSWGDRPIAWLFDLVGNSIATTWSERLR